MKLKAMYETEVFENKGGGVSIKQIAIDGDQLIALYGDQIELVHLELGRLLASRKFHMECDDEVEQE